MSSIFGNRTRDAARFVTAVIAPFGKPGSLYCCNPSPRADRCAHALTRATVLLAAALSLSAMQGADSTDIAPELARLSYSEDQTALDSLDREIAEAGIEARKLAALQARLLVLLTRDDLTYAARQAIAQRLGLVLAHSTAEPLAESLKPLVSMFAEDREADLARLALESAPGEAIDTILIDALDQTSGRARLGVIDSLGRRKAGMAVGALARLLHGDTADTAAAAARALGQIANTGALEALRTTPTPSNSEVSAAIGMAKLSIAAVLPTSDAAALLREIEADSHVPSPVRDGAFRLALARVPATASDRIVDVLAGDDWSLQQVALESIAGSRAPDLVSSLLTNLGAWNAPVRIGVIAALARRGEVAAVPVIARVAAHGEPEVQAAALEALGSLPGSPDIAALLAGTAAGSAAELAKIARQSLARLDGAGVSASILAGAKTGETSVRTAFIEQLALRGMTEGIPLLIQMRGEKDGAIRIAAVTALGELGAASEQRTLLDWTLTASDQAEQTRALRSLVNVTLRIPSGETRGTILHEAIESAEPAVARRLLPALARIGGSASAESAARLAVRDDATLADAALSALDRWSDDTALASLARVAGNAALPALRQAALDSATRYIERHRDAWTQDTTTVIERLLAATNETPARRRLVTFLHRASDDHALALAERLSEDPQIGASATTAADVIRANRAGPLEPRASGAAANIKNIIDQDTKTRWSVPTRGKEWIEIDFRQSRPLQRITLDQGERSNEFPERFEAFVTDDVAAPGTVVVSGTGQHDRTIIEFPAGTRGRYVIIKNAEERKNSQWSVSELYVD